jgi:hypothetical protein
MKKWLFLLLCLVLSPTSAEVYKWVDEDGNIHYSDHSPEEGAEPVVLPEGVYYTPPPLPESSEESSGEESERQSGQQVVYGELVITRPAMNETIRSNEGIVTIEFDIKPQLASGDTFRLIFDGKKFQDGVTDTAVVLSNIERGSHTVKVQVVRDGVVKATSRSVVFHLHKESVFDPNATPDADNSEAFTPDYAADAPSGEEFDATEKPDYGPESADFSDTDPNDSSKSVYDSATTKVPTAKGGGQYKAGSTYTPNYNQKK